MLAVGIVGKADASAPPTQSSRPDFCTLKARQAKFVASRAAMAKSVKGH